MEQRRAQRFNLKLPIEVLRAGAKRTRRLSETCNMSSSGVLFRTDSAIQIGEVLEYIITLSSDSALGEVRLRCQGKVVRVDKNASGIAATLERYEFLRSERI